MTKESSGAARNNTRYTKRIITAEHVLAFVLALILSMLRPSPGGIESHWRKDKNFRHRAGCRSAPSTPPASLSMPFPGHSLATYVPMPDTRHGMKQITTETYKHGTSSGRNKLLRHCFVCQRIANLMQTSNNCASSHVPACPPTKIRFDRFGNQFIFRNELHTDKSMAASARK